MTSLPTDAGAVDGPADALELLVEYAPELFDADRIERLADHIIAAMGAGLADPDRTIAAILPPAERARVLETWNPRPTPRMPGLLHQVVAGHDPDHAAITGQPFSRCWLHLT